jgi:hypothetical protein
MVVVGQEDREVRHVHMQDAHPATVKPTYSGHSIAKWEGNTLVVDSIGFNSYGQLDELGNPNSSQLHVVERWTRSADGQQLTAVFEITDPVYYTEPFSYTREFHSVPGARVTDYDCAENPRSDDFENLTYPDDWFRPVCVRPVSGGVSADKVVCTPPKQNRP